MRKARKAARVRKSIRIVSFPVACGDLMDAGEVPKEALEKEGWAITPRGIRHEDGLCAARAWGNSMEPRVENGHWILFTLTPGGDPRGRLVIMEDRSRPGIVRRTLKKFMATLRQLPDQALEYDEITLHPSNNIGHLPIQLKKDGDYAICGWFVGSVKELKRDNITPHEYPNAESETE